MTNEDGFTLVTRHSKQGRRRGGKASKDPPHFRASASAPPHQTTAFDAGRLEERLRQLRSAHGDFFRACLELLRRHFLGPASTGAGEDRSAQDGTGESAEVAGTSARSSADLEETAQSSAGQEESSEGGGGGLSEILCYGLGSFASDASAQAQLCLLRLLREALGPSVPLFVADPVFCEAERRWLREQMGAEVPDGNDGCRRRVQEGRGRVLLFMPHGGRPMYEAVLGANWSGDLLPRLVVLGNDAGDVAAAPGFPKDLLPHLARAAQVMGKPTPLVLEVRALPATPLEGFNHTVLYDLRLDRAGELGEDFWSVQDTSQSPAFRHQMHGEILLE